MITDDLNAREQARAQVLKVDDATLTAISVDLQVMEGAQTQVLRVPMQMPDGRPGFIDLMAVPMMALIPMADLAKVSRIIQAPGAAPHPLAGMLPVNEARLVVPKTALKPPQPIDEPANVVEFRRG